MAPVNCIIITLILIINIFGEQVSDAACYTRVNGCSVPFRGSFPYSKYFKPACNRHDVCYRCGTHYGWPRADCDRGFLNDMLEICNKENTKRSIMVMDDADTFLDSCCVAAHSYFSGVRVAGGLFYRRTSPDWCSEDQCVIQEGQPNLTS